MPLRLNADVREDMADGSCAPQRDFGWTARAMTRPLLETVLRRGGARHPRVAFRRCSRALAFEASADGRRVTGVTCAVATGEPFVTVPAELVVDASGRGRLTGALLESLNRAAAPVHAVGVDIRYTSVLLALPDGGPSGWKLGITRPNLPASARRAIMLPVEGDRWMLTVIGQGEDQPPPGWDDLLEFMRGLPTPTIRDAVRGGSPVAPPTCYGFPESVWRRFEAVEDFPDGLVPLGDSLCRFNPAHGQGMTVAAKQAVLLGRLLGGRAGAGRDLAGLGREFLAGAARLIEGPWAMATIPDLASPFARGERPPGLERSVRFLKGLARLAARDPAVQRLAVEVWHMLRPAEALTDADLVRRVEAEMATA